MTQDDLKNFEEKLKKHKEPEPSESSNSREGVQAGIELVAAIGVCVAIGYGLDKWLETKPLFLLIWFFIGVAVGFYNIYRLSKNMGYGVGYSQLHQDKKQDKSSSENEESDI